MPERCINVMLRVNDMQYVYVHGHIHAFWHVCVGVDVGWGCVSHTGTCCVCNAWQVDAMSYMEDLQSFVFDESKCVTYKWLRSGRSTKK